MPKKCIILLSVVFLAFFSISGLVHHYKTDLVDYLSRSRPVEANYLIVEGWISDESIHDAVKEFRENTYSRLIVTGGPLENHYPLFVDSNFEFDFSKKALSLSPGDTLSISLKGSPYKKIFPRFFLYLNENRIMDSTVNDEWSPFLYKADSMITLDKLTISYVNDAYSDKEDRNLYVKSLRIKDSIIPARSKNAYFYYDYDVDKKEAVSADVHSHAESCAKKIMSAGNIPPDSIIVLPAPFSKNNRTYRSALTVKKWRETKKPDDFSFNIFSEGIHSRRTWVTYKMVFDNTSDQIGIVSTYPPASEKIPAGYHIRILMGELFGNFYYQYIFKHWLNIKNPVMSVRENKSHKREK
ncbi:MAG: carbohydrate-binding domain-containing protein [Bacteroidota bacterium]